MNEGKDLGREKILAILSLWEDTNLQALLQGTYPVLAPCFWENSAVLPEIT